MHWFDKNEFFTASTFAGLPSSNSGCGCGSNTTVKGPIIGGPFTLMSTQNKIVTEQDLRGKWVLLYFGYSFSPDVGPEQLKMMSKAVDKLGLSHLNTSLSRYNVVSYYR